MAMHGTSDRIARFLHDPRPFHTQDRSRKGAETYRRPPEAGAWRVARPRTILCASAWDVLGILPLLRRLPLLLRLRLADAHSTKRRCNVVNSYISSNRAAFDLAIFSPTHQTTLRQQTILRNQQQQWQWTFQPRHPPLGELHHQQPIHARPNATPQTSPSTCPTSRLSVNPPHQATPSSSPTSKHSRSSPRQTLKASTAPSTTTRLSTTSPR